MSAMYQEDKSAGHVDGQWLAPPVYHEPPVNNAEKSKNYKPFVLWTSTLSVLLGVTIILIAMTEFACQRLPNAENRGIVGSLNNRTGILNKLVPMESSVTTGSPSKLNPRQIATTSSTEGTTAAATPSPNAPTPQYSISTGVIQSDGVDYTVEQSYQLTTVVVTASRTSDPPVLSTATIKLSDGSFIAMTMTVFGDKVSAQATINVAGGVEKEHWLAVGAPKIIGQNKKANGAAPTPVQIPGQEAPKNTDFGILGIGGIGAPTTAPLPSAPAIVPATFIPVATTIINSVGKPVITTVPVALDSAGSTIAIASDLISADATTTFLLKPSATATKGSNGTRSGQEDDSENILHYFTMREYITGSFVPTVLAVLFLIPWSLIDTAAKQMEPIYQLAETGGASAANSLSLNYVTLSMFVAPFRAVSRKHWVIALTSILMLLSLVTPPLAVESIFISLAGVCNADTNNDQCIPTLSVYKTAAHILESVLATMALLLIFLIYIMRKRESHVNAEPLSMAGTASLMQNQEFLNIIRELPTHGYKERALIDFLPPHSYKIGHYQNADGTWGYGFMLSRDISSPNVPYTNSNTYASQNNINQANSIQVKSENSWNRFTRLFQVLGFAFLLIGLLIMIVYWVFFKSDKRTGFGRFMSSQQFGVKFLFTSLGVVIAQFWAYAREMIHRNEPYHNLQKGSSPPQSSILISPSLAPITSIFTSLRRFAPLLIFLDLSTILADALIITLSNVPYSPATTYDAWVICSHLSLAILAFMLFTLLVVLVRIGRFGSSGQDVPNTVVGKCVLMCGSFMLERFAGLGEMEGGERRTRIVGWREKFRLGRVRGVDGVIRRGVDFEGNVEGVM